MKGILAYHRKICIVWRIFFIGTKAASQVSYFVIARCKNKMYLESVYAEIVGRCSIIKTQILAMVTVSIRAKNTKYNRVKNISLF